LGNRRRTVLLKITMAAVGLLNVWSVVVVPLILMLGMLSKVQGGGQQPATTLQSLKTPPKNLAPPDSSYPTTLPLIATTKPHQVSKQLTRSSATGMGTDLFTSLASVVTIFIVGLSTGFWWQLSRRKVQDLEPSQLPDQQQQQQVLKLHNLDAEFGSPRTPQIICNSPREQQLQQVGFLKKFTLEEIQSMTNFFQVVLGEGGQGTVYEASLPGPEPRQKAAVKRLDRNKALDWAPLSSSSNDSKSDHEEEVVVKNPQDSTEKEFWSELHCISRLNHNNIVSLLGYCVQEDQLFLIYEFMEMGSLKHHLHGKKNGGQTAAAMGHHHHLLDWNQRMTVAVDVAQGLEYLHNHAKPTLVHRDIKPSNILFDAGMNAKIADFGLSKTKSLDPTTSLRIRGTPGYVDPVYCITGQATEKNDVYSYGVVLLELVTGKKASENNTSLVHSCRQFLQGGDPDVAPAFHLPKMVDVRIQPTEYAPQQLLDVVQLAMHCVDDDPSQRPNMKEVVKRLYIANHHEEALSSDEISTEVPTAQPLC
jgi:serine/threonine protein kinase